MLAHQLSQKNTIDNNKSYHTERPPQPTDTSTKNTQPTEPDTKRSVEVNHRSIERLITNSVKHMMKKTETTSKSTYTLNKKPLNAPNPQRGRKHSMDLPTKPNQRQKSADQKLFDNLASADALERKYHSKNKGETYMNKLKSKIAQRTDNSISRDSIASDKNSRVKSKDWNMENITVLAQYNKEV